MINAYTIDDTLSRYREVWLLNSYRLDMEDLYPYPGGCPSIDGDLGK